MNGFLFYSFRFIVYLPKCSTTVCNNFIIKKIDVQMNFYLTLSTMEKGK